MGASPPVAGGSEALRLWWLERDKGAWTFFSILGLIVVALGVGVFQVVVFKYEQRDLRCLALNVYHEARGEPRTGQLAVGEVTMNRVRSARYPDDVCEVVFEKRWDRLRGRYVGAFSWTELERKREFDQRAWKQAWSVANTIYYKDRDPLVEGALFYHAKHIEPSWARKKKQIAQIGRHVFYE